MTRFHVVAARPVLVALGLGLCLSSPLLAQRSDRGVIGGVVTDPQGGALPGATVTVRNEATGVENVLTTNSAGAYTTSPLVLGPYSVTVNIAGFKKAVTSGIDAPSRRRGPPRRHAPDRRDDASPSKSRAGTPLDDTRPDVSHSVDEKYYQRPPDRHRRRRPPGRVGAPDAARLPSHVAERRPDVPRKPVQLPDQRRPGPGHRELLRRRRVRLRLRAPGEPGERSPGGGHPGGHGHHDDLFGPVRAHERRLHRVHVQVGHEQVPRKRLRRIWPSDESQHPGLLQGAQDPRWTTRTGGSRWAGPSSRTRRSSSSTPTGPSSAPAPWRASATRRRSRHSGTATSARSWAGRSARTCSAGPSSQGQIFNPATTRTVNGVPVRDPYPGNIIPANDPLRSTVAAKYAALMAQPDRPGLSNNVAGNPAGDQTWELDARNILLRLDHTFSPKLQGDVQRLLQQPPVGPELRRGPGLHRRERPPDRFRLEHGLHRRGLHPAHLHDARPHPVGLDHQQQPDEPFHRGLGPLVHGRRQPLRGRELAGDGCGAPSNRAASSSGTRGRRR